MDDFAVRPVVLTDAESIARIYNRYIASSTVTFEKTSLETADVEGRISETINSFPWLVYKSGEYRFARTIWDGKSGSFQGSRSKIRPVDRCRALAAYSVIGEL